MYRFWDHLNYKNIVFNKQHQQYELIVSDTIAELKLPPMKIHNIINNSDNTTTIDLIFRDKLPELYEEVQQLENKIINILYDNYENIFKTQVPIPMYKLNYLFHRFIHPPPTISDLPLFRITAKLNIELQKNDWIKTSFSFNKLLMKQTHFCLDLIDLKLTPSTEILY
jgi:hypothetical protein